VKGDSGSIGIGAMIVFIALILVAAVASTVIIKSVENLQQKGEDTSNDTRLALSKKAILTSAYILGDSDCEAELFQHSGFGGWSATYPVGSYAGNDFLDPDNDGVNEAVSDDATTIKIDAGCEVILYDEDDFSGWSARLSGGDHSLASINANALPKNCGGGGCNDQISSLKVLGFEMQLHWTLAAGSDEVTAGEVSWTVTCVSEPFAGYDGDTIVSSNPYGSTLLDGTNTAGLDAKIVDSEIIEHGMFVKTDIALKICYPEEGEKMQLTIHIDGGATTYYTLSFRGLDVGTNVLFVS
tara:strand:- start:173 stop:1063 length:891 start_codon:yes stop_codon:yes gene_type:complete